MIDHQVMTHTNLRATNTLTAPDTVVPRKGSGTVVSDGTLTASLPPHSWQMIRVKLS